MNKTTGDWMYCSGIFVLFALSLMNTMLVQAERMSPLYHETSEPQGPPCGDAGPDSKQNTVLMEVLCIVMRPKFSRISTDAFAAPGGLRLKLWEDIPLGGVFQGVCQRSQ